MTDRGEKVDLVCSKPMHGRFPVVKLGGKFSLFLARQKRAIILHLIFGKRNSALPLTPDSKR